MFSKFYVIYFKAIVFSTLFLELTCLRARRGASMTHKTRLSIKPSHSLLDSTWYESACQPCSLHSAMNVMWLWPKTKYFFHWKQNFHHGGHVGGSQWNHRGFKSGWNQGSVIRIRTLLLKGTIMTGETTILKVLESLLYHRMLFFT